MSVQYIFTMSLFELTIIEAVCKITICVQVTYLKMRFQENLGKGKRRRRRGKVRPDDRKLDP